MKTVKQLYLTVLSLSFLSTINCEANTIVDAPAGRFQGFIDTDPQGQSYVAFRGIPYAKPPVGELRFAKPQPLDKLDGTFDATKWGNNCPIPDPFAPLHNGQGDEDCLSLNVYAKQITPGALKKVIVFIHGGGYIAGGSYGALVGSFVSAHNVVYVTINYRLGVLGFLGTGDDASPGNYGLWDMTMALKWVKENIAAFGGDSSDVTIFGESAGASAVGYLSISPHTKGLFNKAHPQSGGPTSGFGKVLEPQKSTFSLAKSLNCFDGDVSQKANIETTKKVVNCLRGLPVSNFTSFLGFSLDNVPFAPTVDNDFIPKSPQKLLKDDAYLQSVGFFQRSYLVGIDNNENSVYKTNVDMHKMIIRQQNGLTDEEKEASIGKLINSAYSFHANSRLDTEVPKAVVEKIINWYESRFGVDAFAYMSGDLGFMVPTFDFVDAAARGNDTKVWLFHFNHYPKYMKGQFRGIVHGLDLVYSFDITLEDMEKWLTVGVDPQIGFDSEDEQLKVVLQSIIAEFVNTGSVPAPVGGSVSWPRYTSQHRRYLDLKPRPEVKDDLSPDLRQLWLHDVPAWMEEERHQHHPEPNKELRVEL